MENRRGATETKPTTEKGIHEMLDLKEEEKDGLNRDHSNYLLQRKSYLQLPLYKNIYTTVLAFWGLVLAEVCCSHALIHWLQWSPPRWIKAMKISTINSPDRYQQIKSPLCRKIWESTSISLFICSNAPPVGGRLGLRLHISNDSQFHSVCKRLQEGHCVGVIDIHKAVSVCLSERRQMFNLRQKNRNKPLITRKATCIPGLFCLRAEESWMPGPQVEPLSQICPENLVPQQI